MRTGGSVECVCGDLTDATICPGPYDFVVERKTLQLFPEAERAAALGAVAARMSPRGVLFTHCHNGNWKPDQPRQHVVEPFLAACGFTIASVESGTANETGARRSCSCQPAD